ncbi:DUF503 domain-containing protein [Marinitoga sp. 1197]|uniref:DUF503 domain-containing protein n=1 Tax=Marinitoga sp. 1197 TaxID=1428449 RepID=UPI00064148E8|nr:DUF503 family protein [Marinitoga sp. 1197]
MNIKNGDIVWVILATYQIELIDVKSLKEKRSIVKKLTNNLRKQHNIAVIESDFNDNKKILEITITTLSKSKDFLLTFFQKIEEEIEYKHGLMVINSKYEIL